MAFVKSISKPVKQGFGEKEYIDQQTFLAAVRKLRVGGMASLIHLSHVRKSTDTELSPDKVYSAWSDAICQASGLTEMHTSKIPSRSITFEHLQ